MEDILKEVARGEGFSDKVLTETFLREAAGYHGVVRRARLTEGERCLAVVVKTAPTEPLARLVKMARDKFLNEIHFYTSVYPELARVGQPPTVPRLVWSRSEEGSEAVVLEDLGPLGYSPLPLSAGVAGDRLGAALSALDRLHAAARRLPAARLPSLTAPLREAFCAGTHFRFTATKCALNLRRVGRELVGEEASAALEKYDMVAEMESVARPEGPQLVITHGDPWLSNILFKFTPDGEVADVALVDWQMARAGPPGQDLGYLCLSSGAPCPPSPGARFGLWSAAVLLPFVLGQADPALVLHPHRLVFLPHHETDQRLAAAITAAHRAGII